MKLSDFRYPLPRNLIAKYPANPRDTARLMVINRADESITSKKFSDIVQYFKKGDCLIVNETKVFPARLFGRKEKTNAKIEVFLLRELNKEENIWDVIVDPARKVRIGNKIFFDDGKLWCEVDQDALTAKLASIVAETVQPENLSLWVRKEQIR